MHTTLRHVLCLLLMVASPGLTASAGAAVRPDHLIAVIPQHFPPIYSVSRNNVPTGFGVEFMELVAETTGLKIEYIPAANWPQVFQLIDDGKADIIPNLGITQRRMKYYVFTKPYDQSSLSIFVQSSAQGIHGLDDLKGRLVGVVNLNRGQTILAPVTDVKVVVYSSLGQLVAALRTGDVDAGVYPAEVFETFTARLGVSESFSKVGQPLETVKRAIAVRKDLGGLIPLLNQGIDDALASPGYPKLYERWHPRPPSYWNATRVWTLVAGLVIFFVVLWLIYRFIVTRSFNRALVRYSNFNKAILDATSDGIVTVDSSYRIVSMNAVAETLFNVLSTSLRDQPISQLLPGKQFHYLFEQVINDEPVTASDKSYATRYSIETLAVKSNRESFPVRVGLSRMDETDGHNVVCTVHDESRAYEAEDRAEQLVNHDPLTGIMNQRGLLDQLSSEISSGADRIYCFCIGLTHMTQINSIYGHHVGDDVLLQVANTLMLDFYDDENRLEICRSSGSHFNLAFINPVDAIENIARAIERSIARIQLPISHGSSPLTIDMALGAAIFPEHASSAIELISNAEIAYVTAKQQAFDTVSVYAPELKIEHLDIETAYQRVKRALSEDRVELYFQPIQTIKSGQIEHYEALVRMHDEDGTIIMPEDIIPVTEATNLITQLDYKVIRLALEKLALMEESHPEVGISVNLSAKHLGYARLYDLIESEMASRRIYLANLTFEITETAALQNYAAAREFMNKLRRFGCRFALDDFGVGFTSFAQLRTLPVDIIKIDGMFIKELHTNKQDEVFVKAMTDVAHSQGKKVVAEYVENKDILRVLERLGVDFAQGFYIGRPSPDILGNARAGVDAVELGRSR